ncbi:hypothetical protein AKI39_22595 [Bordetella sp. H567]|uniref:DUF5621 domain-containing protein n=1 Tax=Bordetella sp. H567 TaxID=1697043 RepID=UPI00081CDF84|nr:DUF5621 domain-containing protein [Bordetella sp. H567]AOB32933.1 hypothetical protein AKI39_22595 [Bordetella sp. H567]
MAVFTVFNHGTRASRDGEGEIVAEFGRLAAGNEYTDYLICDGPGSDPKTGVTPGQFNPYTRDKQAKAIFGNKELGNTRINCALTGALTGAGWDDNVIHAVATIAGLDRLPDTVNMLGWSRGAVTCTKLAVKLREFFPQIAVNIFAVDPVAGIGNGGDIDTSTIPGNVRNYCAVLSMHETRRFFAPQDAQRVAFTDPGTNAIFIPFPGNHAGQAKLDRNVMKNLGEAAEMAWFLAWRFLDTLGTRFKSVPTPRYDGLEQCNLYARMKIKMPDYRQTGPGFGSSLFMGGASTRDFVAKHIDHYVAHANFFINEHHRRIFRSTLPYLYSWIFEGRDVDRAAVIRDFDKTRFYTGLRRTLVDIGFQAGDPAGVGVTIPPGGSGRQPIWIDRQQVRADMSRMGFHP